MKKKYKRKEALKDFATDEELRDWTKELAEKCRENLCCGIACFSAPQSEKAWVAINSDVYTAVFLLKSLCQQIAEHAGISPTLLATDVAWYTAMVESGAFLEEEKIFKKSAIDRAEAFADWNLTQVKYKSLHNKLLDGTPVAQQIKVID